jgi:catechol 2,3-dioxygenase-like lactoylglutathione lyase family enzyme
MTTKPARLSHVVLHSTDPKRLIDWYCDALGGEIVFDSPFFVFMTYDEEHHRVASLLSSTDSSSRTPGTGLSHVAFGFNTIGDLLDHYDRIKAQGNNLSVLQGRRR